MILSLQEVNCMIYEKYEDNQFVFMHEVVSDPDYYVMGKHYHNLFEIYFITSGTCVYFINNKTYHIEPGDIILVPEGVIHNTKYYTPKHTRFLINCSPQYIPSSVRPLLPQLLYLYRNPAIYDEIFDLFNKVRDEFSRKDSMRDEILRCYTHMLFFLMARNINTRILADSGCEYVEQAITYLQQHYSDDISLSKIADMCSVTPVHFSRIFKKETGFGFNNYLNLVRLQKAEIALAHNPKKSVTDIAAECGFHDSNYFSAKFKALYGVSPKQFQKKNPQ